MTERDAQKAQWNSGQDPSYASDDKSPTCDITVCLTAHSETVMSGPTLTSVMAAIHEAQAYGFSCELILGMDTPTDGARAWWGANFSEPVYEFEYRDQGLTRNALVERSRGRWIAFMDADDLMSENWLVRAAEMLRTAEQDGKRLIVHPELNWLFDQQRSILGKTPSDDATFAPGYFYFANYWDALAMAPAAAYRQFPYPARDVKGGFAYEDWQWSLDTYRAGWLHAIAPDTIIFKRRRENSQTIEASSNQVLTRDVLPIEVMQESV